ncbi:hypothetical protein [Cellulomonas wangsupingiae]|uniref:Tetratricopeptide repeat protein n=1 Tax=Cellulomonas wangsupingiae TaxID=2968085 RepID=A0ABY5K6J4_9CELL|nr:hypothetical protein [Cellulomonas wangsupingiae]MCC2336447.1 hypothetical protein [Cellulomonas wangsupingiae]UUI64675.1 hypothetical protein NP075_16375 [Cellulomonas wangsupingiae]
MSRRADAARARRQAAAAQRDAARAAALASRAAVLRAGRQTSAQRRAARRDRIRALPPHVRRRRRLLRWSWLPALLLLGAAANLALLGPEYRGARAAYDADDVWDAVDAFDRIDRWTFVEPWKGPFNAGTARYRARMYDSAVEYLDEALAKVPDEHRCVVQTNRALALQAAEAETTARAEEQLEYAQAVAEATAAQAAGEPFDAEVLEPLYEGGDPPAVDEELWYAGYLFRSAADDAALAAEALADPACTPPPSQGGGSQDEQDQGGGADEEQADQDQQQDQQDQEQDEQDQQDQDQQQGDDGQPDPATSAEQRMQELLAAAGELERLAHAASEGTLDEVPTPGAGQPPTQDPGQAEAERQERLAERNQEAGGGGGAEEAPGGGDGTGTAPGGGSGPGTGGGGGGRNW